MRAPGFAEIFNWRSFWGQLIALTLVGLALLLAGCASAPPIPLDRYLVIRDTARDYMGAVERDTCPRTSDRAKDLCADTKLLRETLAPADAQMIQGYMQGGLSKEQWQAALSVVVGVLGKALKSYIGMPSPL